MSNMGHRVVPSDFSVSIPHTLTQFTSNVINDVFDVVIFSLALDNDLYLLAC